MKEKKLFILCFVEVILHVFPCLWFKKTLSPVIVLVSKVAHQFMYSIYKTTCHFRNVKTRVHAVNYC